MRQGYFVERKNRFVAIARSSSGRDITLHVPNSGRMRELLVAGREVLWQPIKGIGRKTQGRLSLVFYQGTWVSIDSSVPNRLLLTGWQQKQLSPLLGLQDVVGEYTFGNSRFDLASPKMKVLIEAKSVTLVEDGIAMFPDAPTKRGIKHLAELARAADAGWQTMVFFVIQRSDARVFRANERTDPLFAEGLQKARERGVAVFAYKCEVSQENIRISEEIPVIA